LIFAKYFVLQAVQKVIFTKSRHKLTKEVCFLEEFIKKDLFRKVDVSRRSISKFMQCNINYRGVTGSLETRTLPLVD
jgi:hypothetical protein